MKYKNLILILSIFIILVLYIVGPYLDEKYADSFDDFNNDIIRFHVRANSDKKEDQELKLLVRDEVLDMMETRLKYATSLEEGREIIKSSIKDMESLAQEVISGIGEDYGVSVSLGREIFPIRKYGNTVFPQGEYEALIVEIGEAKGQNWWCVMFPPLCFVDITHSVARDPVEEVTELETDNTLEEDNHLEEDHLEENGSLKDDDNIKENEDLDEYIVDETQPLKFKSKIAGWLREIF